MYPKFKFKMHHLIFGLVLLSCLFHANGRNSAGFKVTYGDNHEMPKTVSEATSLGWILIERPCDALLPSLGMYCPSDDVTVCVLYMDIGYMAGLQISERHRAGHVHHVLTDFCKSRELINLKEARSNGYTIACYSLAFCVDQVLGIRLPAERFINTVPSDLSEVGFNKWTPAHGYYAGEEHWYTSQFFISEEILSASTSAGRIALVKSGETLYAGGVWVTDLDGKSLTYLDGTGSVDGTLFTEQACVPVMGTHYYYNMSTSSTCEKPYPWFTLVDGDQLIGTGFTVFGTDVPALSGQTNWFEDPTAAVVKFIVPRGPECLYTLASTPGITTLHMYYINTPTDIVCS